MPLRKNLRNFPDEVHFRLAEQIRQDLPQAWQVLGVGSCIHVRVSQFRASAFPPKSSTVMLHDAVRLRSTYSAPPRRLRVLWTSLATRR